MPSLPHTQEGGRAALSSASLGAGTELVKLEPPEGKKAARAQKSHRADQPACSQAVGRGSLRPALVYPRAGLPLQLQEAPFSPADTWLQGECCALWGLCFWQSVSFAFNFNTLCAMKDSE